MDAPVIIPDKIHLDLFRMQPLHPLGVLARFPDRGRRQHNRRTLFGVTDRPLRPALGT